MDRFIVSKNLQRFEDTNLVDWEYIESLSYSTIPVLTEYYQKNPEMNSVKHLLLAKKKLLDESDIKWQSYNMVEDRARRLLGTIDFEKVKPNKQNGKKYRLEDSDDK